MPLQQDYNYKIPEHIRNIQDKESQILNLLRDVKSNISILKKDITKLSLVEILQIVENEKCIIKKQVDLRHLERKIQTRAGINYEVDLSEAKQMVRNYRNNSEGGCGSCKYIRSYMPLQDEHVLFCKKYEKEDVVDSGNSPRISQFYEDGCDDKEVIIKRKIKEVLEGQN